MTKIHNEAEPEAVPFLSLPDHEIDDYIQHSFHFLKRTGWSWSEDQHDLVVYMTAIYLHQMGSLVCDKQEYPRYVVHSADKDWRFVSDSYRTVYKRWKEASRDGERVALFHWKSKNECVRLQASEGYPFERDYGGTP